MTDVDGTFSGSLLESILPTLLKKWSSDVWIIDLFFSHHRLHSSTRLHSERLLQVSCTDLCLGPMPNNLTVPPQTKKTLLPWPASKNLLASLVTSPSSCLSSFFLWASNSIRSSLVSSSCAHQGVQWNCPLVDLAPASSWEPLSSWRPLWTPCPSSQIHENCEQTAGKVLPNLFHGDGCNFTPSKAMFFMAL